MCKRLNNAGKCTAIDLQKMSILAKKIIFSGEAHFDLCGYVNKKNCHSWGTVKPHAFIEKPTHHFLIVFVVEYTFSSVVFTVYRYPILIGQTLQPLFHSEKKYNNRVV